MKKITTDILIFGFGEITEKLIYKFIADGFHVTCISDQQLTILSSFFVSLRRDEVIQMKVESTILLICWKDERKLFENEFTFYNWIINSLNVSKKCYIFSSASMYIDSPIPLTESENNLEVNKYKNPKFRLENSIINVTQKMSMNYCTLRISNIYGKDIDYGLIGGLLNSIKTGDYVQIYSGVRFIRDYLFVDDLYEALFKLIISNSHEKVLNISSGVGLTPEEVIQLFHNQSTPVKFNRIKPALNDYKECSILDNGRVRQIIDWSPESLKNNITHLF